jgi:DNA-binding transcriptional LysR family regulator
VGAIASAQVSFLVETIAQFRRELPGWRIRLVPGVSLNLLAQVDGGELDAAVMIRPPFALPAELEWCSLGMEPFVLLVPEAWSEMPWRTAIKTMPFVRYDKGSFGGRLADKFLRRARLNVNEVVELDELQAIALLVARGVGVALVPRTAGLASWPEGAVALDLGEHTFYREIGLVQSRQSRQAVTRRFTEYAEEAAALASRG